MPNGSFKVGDIVRVPLVRASYTTEEPYCLANGYDSSGLYVGFRNLEIIYIYDTDVLFKADIDVWGWKGIHRPELELNAHQRYCWSSIRHLTMGDGKLRKLKVAKPISVLCRGCGELSLWIKGTRKKSFVCPS